MRSTPTTNNSVVREKVGPLTDVQGQPIKKTQDVIEALLLQYKTVFSKLKEGKIVNSPMNFFSQGPDHRSHISLNSDNIQQAIKGPNQFPAVLL